MSEPSPFVDLPAGLVEDLLRQAAPVADQLLGTFRGVRNQKAALRAQLQAAGLVAHESDFGVVPIPTTCAVDGSYAIERLLTTDLAACAAVAVEGLTPPSELRHWDEPHHVIYARPEVHEAETSTILRAVMLGNELVLAAQAPHDLVMIDGSLTLPIIYVNQALATAAERPHLHCAMEFREHAVVYLDAYLEVLRSRRTDRDVIGLPKYSTRREVGRKAKWPNEHDDRGLLTFLLEPGQLTIPLPLEQPAQPWHLSTGALPTEIRNAVEARARSITAALADVRVFYYRPHGWLPALRVEVGAAAATNSARMARILQGLKHQCAAPGMLEPYPLFLADRTVKHLARAVPAFRQVVTQRLSETYEGEIGEIFFAMHGYRSESGT